MFDDSSLFEVSTTSRSPQTFVSSFEKSAQKSTENSTSETDFSGFTKVTHVYEKAAPEYAFARDKVTDIIAEAQPGSVEVQESSNRNYATQQFFNGAVQPTEITTVEYYVTDHNSNPSNLKNLNEEIGGIERMMRSQHITTEYRTQQQITNTKLTNNST